MNVTFDEVLEANKESIYRICRIYAVHPIEPKDLFQEVVYELWKSFSTFEGRASVSTWVYRIALNVGLRSKMKLQRSNDKVVRWPSIQWISDTNHDADDQEEKYQALRNCIEGLNEADQSIVVLFLEELPYKEIAAVTGLTENHIAVKMKRIRKKLFDCISQKLG